MVCSCFVFSFDAILEIITTICSFVVTLKVRSPGASELHFLMVAVKMMLIMTSSFLSLLARSKFELYNLNQLLAIRYGVKL